MKGNLNITRSRRREPLTDTQLLLTITVCIFFVMYGLAMLIWGFLKPPPQISRASTYMHTKMQMVMVSSNWVSVRGSLRRALRCKSGELLMLPSPFPL